MAELPDCFDCKYGELGHPCRKADGSFDFEKAGAAIVAQARAYQLADETGGEVVEDEAIAWISDCEYETIEDHPQLLIQLIVAAMDACENPADAAFVAAGLVENAMVKHGPQLIDQVEALAERSPKFSYILSGMWSQSGRVDKDVWARIGRAVSKRPRMSDDGRGASDGTPVVVLEEEQAIELMKERVAEAARALKI